MQGGICVFSPQILLPPTIRPLSLAYKIVCLSCLVWSKLPLNIFYAHAEFISSLHLGLRVFFVAYLSGIAFLPPFSRAFHPLLTLAQEIKALPPPPFLKLREMMQRETLFLMECLGNYHLSSSLGLLFLAPPPKTPPREEY